MSGDESKVLGSREGTSRVEIGPFGQKIVLKSNRPAEPTPIADLMAEQEAATYDHEPFRSASGLFGPCKVDHFKALLARR